MVVDELQDSAPRVGRSVGELGGLTIEEGVWRARITDHLVLDTGRGQSLVERVDHVRGNALIGPAEEKKITALVKKAVS